MPREDYSLTVVHPSPLLHTGYFSAEGSYPGSTCRQSAFVYRVSHQGFLGPLALVRDSAR
jgi:hypothetical protein